MKCDGRSLKIYIFLVIFGLFIIKSGDDIYAANNVPSEYPVAEKLKTPLKSQGNSGYCWAYAGIATLETFLAKNNMFERSLSERHLTRWSSCGASQNGWNISSGEGGTSLTVMGYLASGKGPMFEGDHFENPVPPIRVSGIKYIDVSKNEEETRLNVKKAIMNYGAVASGYGSCYGGHAVSIVGWNDRNQCWIVKDSLTKSYRNLSYNTQGLLHCCINYCITDVEKINPYEKIHQHDQFASTLELMSNDPNTDFANVFDFNGKEKLTSVMFKTECEGANYKISYARTINGVPDTNKKNWKTLSCGVVPYKGFISSKLEQSFIPEKGKGAIILSIKNPSNEAVSTIGCESAYLNLRVPQSDGKSFFIFGNSAIDINNINSIKNQKISALSIKAVTENR